MFSDEFMNQLKNKYIKNNLSQAWDNEAEKLKTILPDIENSVKDRYEFDTPINIGGTAIIIKVLDKNLKTYQALKCSRPIMGKEPIMATILNSEISRLRESSHHNIVSIYYIGEVTTNNVKCPYYIMEFVEGALDAWEFIKSLKPNYRIIINILRQCIEGLVFLHSKNTIHGDVKLENLLVSPDERVKVSDMGSARLLTASKEDTVITFTRPYAHPELRGLLAEQQKYITDENRVSLEIPRSKLKTTFDLYALGKNILRVLKEYDIADYDLMPLYYRQYLGLMGCRMLDGHNTDEDEFTLNLSRKAYKEIKYQKAADVLVDLKKITGEFSIHDFVPEVNHHFPRTIQISSPTATAFTNRTANLLSLPVFRRLSSVSQLGFISQIYPTASHTRLEHILGTFSNVIRFCDSLYNDQLNPLFKQIMDEHDINLILLAALCHDLGQYPLAHDLEEADKDLFSHMEITKQILEVNNSQDMGIKTIMENEWGVKPEEVILLLSADPTQHNDPLKYRLLHTLINGPIDADKIDYLIRDSNNLNVPYGKVIDFERLLDCLTIITEKTGTDDVFISLGIHEKGKIPAEAVAFARYAMFGSVYWHHTSRAIKSMLHHAVWEAMPEDGKDRRSKEYRELKYSLLEEVFHQINFTRTGETGNLFLQRQVPEQTEAPRLYMTDFRMLKWLHKMTSVPGKKIINMICERNIFKRIMVINSQKNHSLWEKLTTLRKSCEWESMRKFQKNVQNELVNTIDNLDSSQACTSVLSKDKTDAIVGRSASGEILFLVDIPLDRKSSPVNLYYLTESRIHGPLKSEEGNIQMEDSVLWMSLANDFLKSVGKIRIFCHPDIVETCTACLTRDKVERALESAHRATTRG